MATSNAGSAFPTTSSTIYKLNANSDGTLALVSVLTDADHGTPRAVGMTFGPDGSLYLVGNGEVGTTQTRFVIRQGTPNAGGWTWATVASSAPYLLTRTFFDHRANALAISPDGSTLVLNLGARTDHGESYGGVREEGLTVLLLQIPADASDTDMMLGTFTSHRSPLGLVFDADSVLADDLKGSACVVSFNGVDDELLGRMNGASEDLIALDLDKSNGAYTVSTRLVASGFDHPVDAAMVGNVIYVIEFGSYDGSDGSRSVHAVTVPRETETKVSAPADAEALTLSAAPNPTQGAVTLTYSLSTPATVRLEIVDALGRTVRVVRTGEASIGSHSVAFSTDELPNGLYLVRLTADGRQNVQLLTVLR